MQITKFCHEFQVISGNNFSFYYIKKKKYLIFSIATKLKFIEMPNTIVVKKKKNLFFKNLASTSLGILTLINFQKNLLYMLNTFDKSFKKCLVVKGLGMRIRYKQSSNILMLKLGFSNLLTVAVPSGLKIFKNKNLIIMESSDASLVGNFANLIRTLRYPDSYKGKGIWYKNEIQILKPVKKV